MPAFAHIALLEFPPEIAEDWLALIPQKNAIRTMSHEAFHDSALPCDLVFYYIEKPSGLLASIPKCCASLINKLPIVICSATPVSEIAELAFLKAGISGCYTLNEKEAFIEQVKRLSGQRNYIQKQLGSSHILAQSFDVLLDSSEQAVFLTNKAGYFTRVNKIFCDLTGYSEADILRKNLALIGPETQTPECQRKFTDILIGTSSVVETDFLTKEKEQRNISITVNRLSSGQWLGIVNRGHLGRMHSAVVDVKSTPVGRALANKLAGSWVLNLETDVLVQDNVALELAGGRAYNTLEDIYANIHQDDLATVDLELASFLGGKSVAFNAQYRIRTLDGSWKWGKVNGVTSKISDTGRIVEISGTISEIESPQDAVEQIRRMNRLMEVQNQILLLNGKAISEEQVYSEIVNLLYNYFEADIATFYLLDKDKNRGALQFSRNLPEEARWDAEFLSVNRMSFENLSAGRPIATNDYASINPKSRLTPYAKGLILIPILSRKRPVGMIGLGFNKFMKHLPELEILKMIGRQVGNVLHYFNISKALSANEKLYRTLVENAPVCIHTVSLDGRLTSINKAGLKLNGLSKAEQVVGEVYSSLASGKDSVTIESAVRQARAGNVTWFQFALPVHGQERVFNSALVPVYNEFGFVVSLMGISEDITVAAQTKEALVKAKDKAEETQKLQSSFLANMSHEIRTPLTAIIGFASILSEESDDSDSELPQLIEQSGRRLYETLNSVLELSRIEAGQITVEPEPHDLTVLLRESVRLMQPLVSNKPVTLHLEPSFGDLTGFVDKSFFNQIINNVLGNSIKYTPSGEIVVSITKKSDFIQIKIKDTGIGISGEFISNVFTPFRQEESASDRSNSGVGLGLSITQKLIKLLKGTIEISSKKNAGTIVALTFPASLTISLPKETLPKTSKGNKIKQAQPIKILAVEDNTHTRMLLSYILKEPFSLDMVSDADSALKKIQENLYDVLYIDINLQSNSGGTDRTGMELQEMIKAIPEYQSVPTIAVTAFALQGDRQHFIDSGFDEYIEKPFKPDFFRQKILDVVESSRAISV